MPKIIPQFIANLFLIISISVNTCYSQITVVSSGATGNQVNIGSAYTQNFNTLPSTSSASWTDNSTLPGWYITDEKNGASVTIVAGTGSSNGGNTYSFGGSPSTDRSIGYLGSGSQDYFNCATRFVNSTGSAIQSFSIFYIGEQWRSGSATYPGNNMNKLEFFYQVFSSGSGSMPTTSTSGWTSVSDLDFSPPQTSVAGNINGNWATNRTAKSHSFNVNVPNGSEIYFMWHGGNGAGNDAGISIDDLSITPATTTVPVEFIDFDAERFDDHVLLTWSTASELNNHLFEIQKSTYGEEFVPIAEVSGNGTTNEIQHYSYTDYNASPSAFYRLKQIDYDGTYAYSKVVRISNQEELISFNQDEDKVVINLEKFVPSDVYLLTSCGKEIMSNHFFESYSINKSLLTSGMYVLVVRCDDQIHHYRFVKQ